MSSIGSPTRTPRDDYVPGNRGTDHRIEEPNKRIRASERKAMRGARRQPYEALELSPAGDDDAEDF